MPSNDDKSPKNNKVGNRPKSGGRPKGAKPAIIDLKADEVKTETAKSETPPKEAPAMANKSDPASDAKAAPKQAASKQEAPKPDATKSAQPPAAASGGGSRSLVAGLVGGLLGAGALYGGLYTNVLPMPGQAQMAEGEQATAAIKTTVDQLGGRIDALEARPQPVAPTVSKDDVSAITSRIAALEKAPAPVDASGDVEALREKLESLSSDLSTLNNRVANISTTGEGATVDLTPMERRVDGLDGILTTLKSTIEGFDVPALSDRVSGLASDLTSLDQKVDQSVSDLSGKISAAEQAVAEQAARAVSADGAQVHTALALRDAVARGMVPGDLIEKAESLGLNVTALKSTLDGGLVSREVLHNSFAAKAGAMLAAAEPAESGILGRLSNSARALVAIRPAGPQAGDTPEAIISRIENALTNDNIGVAASEFGALAPAVRAAAGDVGIMIDQRQKALALADQLVTKTIDGQ